MLHFQTVCDLLEKVQSASGHKKKLEILKEGFAKFREDTGFNIQSNFEKFYQGIRLIVPEMDHGRKTYNMKEHKISRAIIKMLNLGEGNDKKNLLSFSEVLNIDFADAVHSIMRKYISKKLTCVTVDELNNDLDLIANRDTDTKLDELMLKMFRKLNNTESKWIIRIILKKLKLGIDNNKILNAFHPDAVEYYKSNNNLKKVCEILWEPTVKLSELNLTIFESFQPMLSKRSDVGSFIRDFSENKTYFVETKFDGERFQLHMKEGQFKYFSRNGFDFTNEFGENFISGTLTQYLKNVFHHNIKSVILDGEMMLWHKKKRKFGSKGMTLDVKKLKVTNEYYRPCFCVFDILLLNDTILTNEELTHRLKLLRETVKRNIEGTIILSDYQEANSRQGIIDILNKSMDTEQEGIVVKDPKSIYKYKDRKSGWYKIKMEYFEDGVTDLDLILMGGYYRTNSDELTSFLVGVFSNDKDKSVLSFGKVSSGLNFEELDIVNKRFSDLGVSRAELDKSKGKLIFGKDIPDVWLEPENSLIFTIRATELVRCSNESFRTSYTIRFPRILKIREDKPYEDCLSVNELLELCQKNKAVIKLNKRHLELDDVLKAKKKRKTTVIDVDRETLQRTGNFLSSMKIFVITGNEELAIGKIEDLILRFGGTICLQIEEGVQIVLVGTITPKVTELLKKDNKFDVVKVEWLQRVTNAKRLLKYKQDEVLHIGTSFYNSLADDVDMYGDSFTEVVNSESLRSRLSYMAEQENFINLNNTIIFKPDLPMFNKFIAYFDTHETINDSHSELIYNSFLDEIEFKYRLGTVTNILNSSINLIVIGPRNENRKQQLENYAKSVNCTCFQVVCNSQLYSEEEF
ncbi:DNA ligase 4 [Coccinella septempunctata]|uniref:DNA ligase 4 n=1 Tax=Coccinella septempunctata TaxID=41139 RepID=UPI001D08470D|nr:DNA ligase 4 [Coccinella septempunctata]